MNRSHARLTRGYGQQWLAPRLISSTSLTSSPTAATSASCAPVRYCAMRAPRALSTSLMLGPLCTPSRGVVTPPPPSGGDGDSTHADPRTRTPQAGKRSKSKGAPRKYKKIKKKHAQTAARVRNERHDTDNVDHDANAGGAATAFDEGQQTTSSFQQTHQPFTTVPRPPSMAEARAAVAGDAASPAFGLTNSDNAFASTNEAEEVEDGASMGWSYDTIDPRTGQTRLDKLYESHLSRIHAIMAQPLPSLPPDGSLNPDFFVGFAHYQYRLRDEYRALIARELNTPVRAVRLSVAWSGRFNVSQFNRVQKVCGVFLDRDVLAGAGHGSTSATGSGSSAHAVPPLPFAVAKQVEAFVREINHGQSERLLSAQLVQASAAIPEVEFAMTHLEQRWLAHMHDWIARHALQTALAVFVVGGNALARYATAHTTTTSGASSSPSASVTVEGVTAALATDAEDGVRQNAYVDHNWVKMFHNRQVVPRVMALGALAGRLAAVTAAELDAAAAATADGGNGESSATVATLPPSVQTFVRAVASRIAATTTSSGSDTEEDALYEAALHASLKETFVHDADALVGALTWWRLCQEALLFQYAPSPTTGTRSTNDADVFYRFSVEKVANNGDLPAAFVHGAFLGGMSELRYLQHNRAALDAVVLHPNDIDFKKKFAGRMKSGHSRLRMEEEAQSPYAES